MKIIILNSYFGYIFILVVCVLASMRSNSLTIQWICLEVNIISIIPLFINQGGVKNNSLAVKYFISQRAASVWLITRYLLSSISPIFNFFIQLALLFKLGVAPFQGWLISLLLSLNYYILFITLSIQKIIPLIIFKECYLRANILIASSLITLFVVVGLIPNIVIFHYLVFSSSLVNSFWILLTIKFRGLWLEFIIIYSIILLVLLILLAKLNVYKVSDLSIVTTHGSLLLSLRLINLGGIPPILGFFLKLIIMKVLVNLRRILIFLILTLAVVVLYIYTNTIYCVYTFTPSIPQVYINTSLERYIWFLRATFISSTLIFILI